MARKERMVVPGNKLVETIQNLFRRGDNRKACLLNEEKHLLDIPLTVNDPAAPANALEAPVLAAIRAIGSLLDECTVEVEKAPRPRVKTTGSPKSQTRSRSRISEKSVSRRKVPADSHPLRQPNRVAKAPEPVGEVVILMRERRNQPRKSGARDECD